MFIEKQTEVPLYAGYHRSGHRGTIPCGCVDIHGNGNKRVGYLIIQFWAAVVFLGVAGSLWFETTFESYSA